MTLALVIVLSMTGTAPAAPARSAFAPGGQEQETTPPAPPSESNTEIRRLLSEGQGVVITDDQGRQVEGTIGTLSSDRLTLVSRNASDDFRYASIVRIDRPRDGLGNGALWGFGIGAGWALAGLIAEEHRECDDFGFFSCSGPSAGAYVAFPLMVGGLGAAIGVGIDAAIRREPNIYRRSSATRVSVVPTLGYRRRGVAVALSW